MSVSSLLVDTGATDTATMTNTEDLAADQCKKVATEVQHLVGEISERFVPQPSDEARTTDAILGIGEFKTRCRWAEYWRNRNKDRFDIEQRTWASYYHANPDKLPQSAWERSKVDPNWLWPDPYTKLDYHEEWRLLEEREKAEGFKTNLKPSRGKTNAPEGSPELECFLKQLEEEILKQSIDEIKENNQRQSAESDWVNETLKQLADSDLIAVPTDKTNSFRTMTTNEYIRQVTTHLNERATEIQRPKLVEIYEHCVELLEFTETIASDNEQAFLVEKVKSKAIPQPKILIKDHKNPDSDGTFPSRLVVPATNFTAGFPKLGYLGIQSILDQNGGLEYGSRNLVQASDLKDLLERKNYRANKCTIASIDAEMMYPSIKFGLIKKAVEYYSCNLQEEDKKMINVCLEMIKFGMTNTLITFADKYYLYDGDMNVEDKGLTIGGYESAWLADLAMSYLLETIDQTTMKELDEFKIYRDDGFGIFAEILNAADLNDWLSRFQDAVNAKAGNDFLKFTAVLWKPNGPPEEKVGKVSVSTDKTFPFLDMKLQWKEDDTLFFSVFLKPNQELKYLNAGSSHNPGCLKAIPNGVCHRLAKLTTANDETNPKGLDELYPDHFGALSKANLLNDFEIPTLEMKLQEIQATKVDTETNKIKKRRERDRKRQIYFKIGFCTYWRKPIHKTIKDVKSRFPSLKWLRVAMSYHRFLNLRELFQGDLNSKVLKGVESLDFKALPCNCRNTKACPYQGKCRSSICVYQATCLQTNKKYIGCTQQPVKKRIQQHVQDTKRLFIDDKKSDSFASHFAQLVPEGTLKKEVRNFIKVKVDILWQGDPLACVKTFGTKGCKLCNKERWAILNLTRKTPELAINRCNEVYGACRHKPRFHRFNQQQVAAPSTDESDKDERVPTRPSSTTSMESNRSTDSDNNFNDRRESTLLLSPFNAGYKENRKNGLQARFQIEPRDQPEVVSNLEKSPQENPDVNGEPGDLPLAEAFIDI